MTEQDDILDVVVVGAGLSGLAAARELFRAGVRSLAVLEARDRVGGRVLNMTVAQGHPVEMGATWVGPGQSAVIDLAHDLGLGLRPQYNKGETVVVLGEETMRVPTTASPITNESFIEELDALAATVPADAPWTAARGAEWDSITFADHLAASELDEEDAATISLMCTLTFGAAPEELSFLYVLSYIHAAGSYGRLEAVEGGAQESRVVGGSQAIATKMAHELGDVVRLSTTVRVLRDWDKAGPVQIETAFGAVKARQVIIALSPSQAAAIDFQPALPVSKAGLIAAWPTAGSGIKAFASYEAPFWREQGLSGDIFDFGGAFAWAADASPDDASIGVLGTLALSENETAAALNPEQRKEATLETFARCFGAEALNPTAYVELDWSQEEHTRGCVSPLRPGVLTQFGSALREITGRVSWAGTETATVWTGYMDGAVRAGRRAAIEALAALSTESSSSS